MDGRKEGRERGMDEGKDEGRKEGRKKERKEDCGFYLCVQRYINIVFVFTDCKQQSDLL